MSHLSFKFEQLLQMKTLDFSEFEEKRESFLFAYHFPLAFQPGIYINTDTPYLPIFRFRSNRHKHTLSASELYKAVATHARCADVVVPLCVQD